jgi:hypothetical protein
MLAAATLFTAACGQKPAAAITPAPPVAAALAAAASLPAARAPGAPTPDAGAPDDGATTATGWLDLPAYKLKLEEIRRCGAKTARGAQPAGATIAPTQVGALVHVAAKVNELFVTPRDVSLERGGVILDARYLDQAAPQGCAPLLPQKQLRAGQTVHGIVLFEVPPSFRAKPGPVTLAFHPTRWGGAA